MREVLRGGASTRGRPLTAQYGQVHQPPQLPVIGCKRGRHTQDFPRIVKPHDLFGHN